MLHHKMRFPIKVERLVGWEKNSFVSLSWSEQCFEHPRKTLHRVTIFEHAIHFWCSGLGLGKHFESDNYCNPPAFRVEVTLATNIVSWILGLLFCETLFDQEKHFIAFGGPQIAWWEQNRASNVRRIYWKFTKVWNDLRYVHADRCNSKDLYSGRKNRKFIGWENESMHIEKMILSHPKTLRKNVSSKESEIMKWEEVQAERSCLSVLIFGWSAQPRDVWKPLPGIPNVQSFHFTWCRYNRNTTLVGSFLRRWATFSPYIHKWGSQRSILLKQM